MLLRNPRYDVIAVNIVDVLWYKPTWFWISSSKHPVANALKVLPACIFKYVNNRTILNITYSHKYCQIQYAHACFHFFYTKILKLLSRSRMNLTILVATSQLKNSPVFTDSVYRWHHYEHFLYYGSVNHRNLYRLWATQNKIVIDYWEYP